MTPRVVSLFSGIGGLDLGLTQAGWSCVLACEIDPQRRAVLTHHDPGLVVHDDVTTLREVPGCELLAGGFPCQDVSEAGRRAGLDGARSGLFYEFAAIADAVRPRLLLIENVPGLLTSHGGRDFGEVLGVLADIGYGLAWRVLDSRYFGVPHRRRRVFLVGARATDDPPAAARRAGEILAVGRRCARHSQTRRGETPDLAVASLSGLGTGGPDDNDGQNGRIVARPLVAHPKGGRYDYETETFVAETSVRRLTPIECERLQGLPDDWTAPMGTDTPRYQALGDAVTVPVAQWLGRRLYKQALDTP